MVRLKPSISAAIIGIGIWSMAGGICTLRSYATPQTAAMLSGEQILQRCQAAYQSVKTLDETVHSLSNKSPASAHILFQSPATLRVSGQTLFPGQTYDMVSDSKSTSVLNGGQWQREPNAEGGIAAITGISGSSGTTVPAILTHVHWGALVSLSSSTLATVAKETVNGQQTYRVSVSFPSRAAYGKAQRIYWIDSHTFFLVKSATNFPGFVNVVTYDTPIVNKPIPASAFQNRDTVTQTLAPAVIPPHH